jgi:hypothetical protein
MDRPIVELRDFIDATVGSARRTRTLMTILVVACVLAFAGFLNSLPSSWMLQRIQVAGDPASPYVAGKLGIEPTADDPRYQALHGALVRSWVDNAMSIDVPFFGVAFDINDLGLLGGISFVTILLLMRFSLRTEISSLRLAFKAAAQDAQGDSRQLERFYDLLAAQQVFTLPHIGVEPIGWVARRPWILRVMPKLTCFLPLAVYSLVAVNDYLSQDVANAINPLHTRILLVYTGVLWGLIAVLSTWCYMRLMEIDRIWDEYWTRIQAGTL